jgi:uncharacterized membrane protein YfcA
MPFVFFAHAIAPGLYAAYAAVTVASGVAAGAVGVGGVLLTPTLILLGVGPREATYAVVSSMFPLAVIYATQRIREGPDGLHRHAAAAMCVGALPGAVAGGLLLPVVSKVLITVTVGSIALLSGLHTLAGQARKRVKQAADADPEEIGRRETNTVTNSVNAAVDHKVGKEGGATSAGDVQLEGVRAHAIMIKGASGGNHTLERDPDVVAFMARFHTVREKLPLVAIGLLGGFMSVMTSSGGPFCMIPLLFLTFGNKIPAHAAVALAWTAGIIVCGTLAVVASITAEVDLGLALVTCVSCQLGIPFGVRLGKKANKDLLRSLISTVLLGLGVSMFVSVGVALSAAAGGDGGGGETNYTSPSPS